MVAARWNCTLTDIGSNSHVSQNMVSTVIRQLLMKMSFTFSVSKISELFWNLNKKFIIILGGRIGLGGLKRFKSVWLGRMTKLGLEWSKGPDLLFTRYGHRSIVSGNQIYHIGGDENMWVFNYSWFMNYFLLFRKTEKWTIKADGIKKELLDLELNWYSYYPEIFLVNDGYCQ